MKKIIKIMLISLATLNFNIFAKDYSSREIIEYKLNKNIILESIYGDTKELKKDTILKCNTDELEFFVTNETSKNYRLLICPLYTDNCSDLISYDKDLELYKSIKLFNVPFYNFIPVYYLDVLEKQDASLIYEYQNKWNKYKNKYKTLEGENFEESFFPETIQISNLYITFGEYNHYLIKEIINNSDYYKLALLKQNDIYYDNFPFADIFVQNSKKKEISIILKFDGDYVELWFSSISDSNYIGKFFLEKNMKTICEISNLINKKKYDSSKVYWPRYSDGSSDFDKEIKSPMVQLVDTHNTQNTSEVTTSSTTTVAATNVFLNKTMSVSENLKLRSGEATSTQVLTVMSAGTKVKILELGKAENIDGINSNWVKVEVISGRDRDGKDIKKKTTGWCYGGYLE